MAFAEFTEKQHGPKAPITTRSMLPLNSAKILKHTKRLFHHNPVAEPNHPANLNNGLDACLSA